MPMDLMTFMSQLNDALVAENGPNLAYLLRPTSPHGKDLMKEFRNPTRPMFKRYEGSMQSPWDEIAIQYVLVCGHIAKRRPGEAFKEHSQLVSLFLRFFTENRGWTLPALFSVLRDLRDLAFDADHHAKYNGQRSECMEDAARTIAKAFGNCMTDRTSPPDQSRKWGIYYVVGLVLKCYFRVKRISLSKNVLRALDANTDIPPLSAYPRSHQVTYRYYLGMLSFLNEEYAKSEQELTLAFYHCHIEAHSNQERILTYLIPLRILKGHLPSEELMRRFPILDELYAPFIAAIRVGDIATYDRALESRERRLVELNLWLTLEKARELCLRGLFRRVWVATNKSTRIPILMFHSSLKISGVDVVEAEAECLVANMIYKGFMRGYISHEKQMVVLAQTNAFPRLADRQTPFAMT
ncbi:putative PCI domain contatining protein [Lyophyllum shimeji]|uniref:PCI domain contatining protein n=1 Tax=Lyophyllum shimeji TaxID=47721 RepID=A0A9P3PE05_LYOSH|nr:putative PCI domain contatining protein [Lyophyllum shimeji]